MNVFDEREQRELVHDAEQRKGRMKSNIYLAGFMGCGKSRLGETLAASLNLEVSDTDLLVRQSAGMDIPEIFSRYGEEGFRKMESEVLRSLPDRRLVITGGGLPCSEANWEYMKQTGYIVYIEVAAAELLNRLKQPENKRQRPLIQHLNDNELQQYIETTLKKRKSFYDRADYIFNSGENGTDVLVERLKNLKL